MNNGLFKISLLLITICAISLIANGNMNSSKSNLNESCINFLQTTRNEEGQYVIDKNYTLNNDTLILPDSAILYFKGGKLLNGHISGNNILITGKIEKCFSNISFSGSLQNSLIEHSWFDGYKNDMTLLSAMFSFLFNDNDSATTLTMEPMRVYNVNGPKLDYGHALFEYYNCSNKTIIGNNATINDLRTRKLIKHTSYDGVFLFSKCSGIIIHRLNYTNYDDDYPKILEENNVLYESGFENQVGYVGPSYILLQNDCSNIYVDTEVTGARYGVKFGDYSKHWLCGDLGLRNSTLKITAFKTGYPVAIEVGDSLNIEINSERHHRAAYLCGISDSNIKIEAKDIFIAPYHCLLSDSRYSNSKDSIPRFKSCSNLNVSVIDNGTKIATNKDSYCLGFQTYTTFKERKEVEIWDNISINIVKKEYAPKIGLFAFTRMNDNDVSSPQRLRDEFRNISIIGSDLHSSNQYSFRIRLSETAVVCNFKLDIHAPYSESIVENHTGYKFDFSKSVVKIINQVSSHI